MSNGVNNELQMMTPSVIGTLKPIIPDASGRYSKSSLVACQTRFISAGTFLDSRQIGTRALAPQWSSYIHPEGQTYYHRDASLKVVTECNLYVEDVSNKIISWVERIETMLAKMQMVTFDRIELFVQLDGEDCEYYLVDNLYRTIFWVQSVDTESLGMPYSASQTHLQLAKEQQYWTHVEHFPMHLGSIPVHYVDELIGVFSHGLVDHMTSTVSTFEHSKADCEKYISILQVSRQHTQDGRQICLVARLLASIARHRFNIHYGEERCRLSRDETILDDSVPSDESSIYSMLSCRSSNTYLTRLKDVFVDRLVYVEQWQSFMEFCQFDWKWNAQVAFAFLILTLSFYVAPLSVHPILTFSSLVFFLSALVSSVLLISYHKGMDSTTAAFGLEHLNKVYSEQTGFRNIAFVYALPEALNMWGVAAVILNAIYLIVRYFGGMSVFGFGAVLSMGGVAVLRVAFSRRMIPAFSIPRFLPWNGKKTVERENEKYLVDIV